RETFITDIIMGWPAKTNLADIIFGKTFDSVVNQTNQHVFITRFALPPNVHKRLYILCPHFAEKEPGFQQWIARLLRVASQLSLRITLFATNETHYDFTAYTDKKKLNVQLDFKPCNDLSNLAKIGMNLTPNDIIVLISARKGSISYTQLLDILPKKMVKQFRDNSLIFLYPEIEPAETLISYTQETSGGLLEKGIDLIRSASSIFKK